MKRGILHVLFWSLYFFQNVLLIFLVNATRHAQPMPAALLLAVKNCLVLLLPKMGLTYFLFRFGPWGKPEPAGQRSGMGATVLGILAALLLYRVLVYVLIDPFIYHWSSGLSLLHPLGMLVALMDLGFVAGAALAIRQFRLQGAYREREEQLVRERLETELRFLRAQLHPHFLFNTLNNIYALARRKSDQTAEVVLRLSKLLRFMLYESTGPLISITDEVRLLEDYIALEEIRYDNRLTVNFYREIDNGQEQVSPLLLLPLVENAFKHGPGGSHAESLIHIDLVVKDGLLRFTVENTVEEPGGTATEAGIGLKNMKRQLELLYRKHDLSITKENGMFTAELTVNLETYETDLLPRAGRRAAGG